MNKFTEEDNTLLEQLGVEVEAKEALTLTPREERIIAGFEDIQRFVSEHGRLPQHGEDKDIFERLYAVRLEQIRSLEECKSILEPLDYQGILEQDESKGVSDFSNMDDDALLAELGIKQEATDIAELKHVRSSAEKRAASMVADRISCDDFEKFKPLFEKAEQEIEDGTRFSDFIKRDKGFLKASIETGEFFVLGGQMLYVADVGESFKAPNGEVDARLRVIYSNGTESNILLRSLQRAFYADKASRKIWQPNSGPLFSDQIEEEDLASGTVYVLRSKSDDSYIAENREIIHKIGVTSGKVKRRIANARLDPTFLLADVDIVATYELFNVNRTKLENLIHKIFEPARLVIEIQDRFGNPIMPKEWFLVPLPAINEAIEKIKDGTISEFVYNADTASFIPVDEAAS